MAGELGRAETEKRKVKVEKCLRVFRISFAETAVRLLSTGRTKKTENIAQLFFGAEFDIMALRRHVKESDDCKCLPVKKKSTRRVQEIFWMTRREDKAGFMFEFCPLQKNNATVLREHIFLNKSLFIFLELS